MAIPRRKIIHHYPIKKIIVVGSRGIKNNKIGEVEIKINTKVIEVSNNLIILLQIKDNIYGRFLPLHFLLFKMKSNSIVFNSRHK